MKIIKLNANKALEIGTLHNYEKLRDFQKSQSPCNSLCVKLVQTVDNLRNVCFIKEKIHEIRKSITRNGPTRT
jgi:hypothetical protein